MLSVYNLPPELQKHRLKILSVALRGSQQICIYHGRVDKTYLCWPYLIQWLIPGTCRIIKSIFIQHKHKTQCQLKDSIEEHFFFLFNFPLPWNKLLRQHCVPGAQRLSDYRAALVCPQWDGVFQNTLHMCWCLITLQLSCLLVSHWGILTFQQRLSSLRKHEVPSWSLIYSIS